MYSYFSTSTFVKLVLLINFYFTGMLLYYPIIPLPLDKFIVNNKQTQVICITSRQCGQVFQFLNAPIFLSQFYENVTLLSISYYLLKTMKIKQYSHFRNVTQLPSNFYELHCYNSNFIYNNQFSANFEMSQSLPFLMNMSNYIIIIIIIIFWSSFAH